MILGRTEIDFRLYVRFTKIYPGYYILDTSTGIEILRDDDRENFIADDRYGSIVVDVAGDSELEIITVTPANNLRCLDRDGAPDVWNLGSFGGNDQLGSPALYDLDDDGKYEVVLGHYKWGATDELLIVNAEDGTIDMTIPGVSSMSAPVIGDADNDGEPEIVLVSGMPSSGGNKVFSVSSNGTIEWQKSLGSGVTAWPSPIMGDFDSDGEVEVVAVTDQGVVYYFSGLDGSLKRTVSTGLTVKGSPVAADVNNDGYLEVIIVGLGSPGLVAIDRHGNKKVWASSPSWASIGTPAVADTNGDTIPEVIVADDRIRVFDWSGLIWSTSVGSDWRNEGNAPVVFDSDNDGLLDIVYFMTTTSDTRLYKVATTTSSATAKKWVTFKGDFRRSGVYGSDAYGADPDIIISNTNWTYGNVSAGSRQYKDFRLINVGNATLTGQCINTTKISINDTSPFSIAPGSSKGYRAIFDTSEQGNITGFVVITNINDPDEPKFNITATANITQPEHDITVYKIHVADQLNPNYVNVPPIKVEYRNLGSFREEGITVNMTINGTLATPLDPTTFDIDPGDAINVTYYWNRSNPAMDGEGIFPLRSAAQNVNFSIEADTMNNVVTKNVEVSFPVKVESITSYLMTNLTYGTPSNNFTEGDWMSLKVTFSNQWNVPVTLIPVINVVEAAGSVQDKGFALPEMTISAGGEKTIQPTFLLDQDVVTDTSYNATAYAWDRMGGGVKILADPYVHTFWVQPST